MKTGNPGRACQSKNLLPIRKELRATRTHHSVEDDQELRAMYDDVVKQGVPDRFTNC